MAAQDNDETLALGVTDPSKTQEAEQDRDREGKIDWVVFGITSIVAVAFVIWGFLNQASLAASASTAQSWVIVNFGWFFVLTSTVFVVFVLWLAASRYGKVPLGRDGEPPEFRTVSWVAMMFSAGMGIGLMFFGVAEPLSHYVTPPPGTASGQTSEAMQVAMATTLFHWTLHPWAMYAIVGLVIAYGTFRRGRSQLISAAFRPLIGKHANGPVGRVIDMMAIFATLFGSAASLGLGALQIAGGLEHNGWIENPGKLFYLSIIVVLTVAFVASAVSGIGKGIQWLSNTNMVLALVLAVFVFMVGPTLLMLNLLPTSIGVYIKLLPEMMARTSASGGEQMDTWLASWTVFYWAWWISWTPFVGMFIARISRGRTIRQFVTGVLLVPSLVSLVWFTVFGGAGIDAVREGSLLLVDGVVNSNYALYELLESYPLASATSVLVMLLVAIFFVSGADAASLVMGTLSEHGTTEPSRATVIFWGALTGTVAAIMLAIGDPRNPGAALTGLQNLTIIVALPFVIVMVLLCLALYRDLRKDPMMLRHVRGTELIEKAVLYGAVKHGEEFYIVVREKKSAVERSRGEAKVLET
ncbi:BCCT family transporter [Pseudomonas guariconensis]|uniref:BCCT family transporter n=1 Tax=Pseudomonas TaxID=286 RepID=UPI001CE3F4D2|nr:MULTISPECIES: BCCT family transporter [Pseudomonas]MCO7638737.1 BCCT family transporter [Pseudomonas sp. S 311-6]MCO7514962.1 BCCT family transporter [Pseudomonas putida]MCO7564458.1 BCCT family transporter [Pseudomonas mosselii]MCO7595306.1 BCCT family transporter [Pseudomonas guariconensis]MCO7604189.1 BCCT family transporter [Pseudomonas guariconensis]